MRFKFLCGVPSKSPPPVTSPPAERVPVQVGLPVPEPEPRPALRRGAEQEARSDITCTLTLSARVGVKLMRCVQATPSMLTTRGTTTAAATAPPSRASPGPPPAGTAGRWPSENGLRLKLKSIKYFLLFLRKNI